ncbi:MAG: SHOCT domain-containing protein [Candidatus Limnocylindria bacterium]
MPRRIGVLAALVVVLVIGLLYVYRGQAPAAEQISYEVALTEIEAGRVRSVAMERDSATLTLDDGTRQHVTLDGRGDDLVRAITEQNAREPGRVAELRFEQGPASNLFFSVVSLLPLLLLAALVLSAAHLIDRGRMGRRYEILAKVAELRDRGALTEEEFKREKDRILR